MRQYPASSGAVSDGLREGTILHDLPHETIRVVRNIQNDIQRDGGEAKELMVLEGKMWVMRNGKSDESLARWLI